MKLSDMIAVMQAAERGEAIESCAQFGLAAWEPCEAPIWNWLQYQYRIAPKKPREFTIALHEGKVVGVGGVERGDYVVIDSPKSLIGVTTIRVREVVELPNIDAAIGEWVEGSLAANKAERKGRYTRWNFGLGRAEYSDDQVTWRDAATGPKVDHLGSKPGFDWRITLQRETVYGVKQESKDGGNTWADVV